MTKELAMDLVNPDDSREYALQVVKWSVQNSEAEALQAALDTHFKDSKLTDFPQDCAQVLFQSIHSLDNSSFQTLVKYVDDDFLSQRVSVETKTLLTKLLCAAVESGEADKVNTLARRGADVNVFYQGRPVLHLAFELGYSSVATCLIEAGADLHTRDKRGNGVLAAVIISQVKDKADLVKTLLDKGVDPLQKSISGKLPLHIAATCDASVIDVLMKTGYDVNVTDDVHGETPLHHACSSCCKETVIRLIQHGASFNLVNKRGETPLHKLLRFAIDNHDFHSKIRREFARCLVSFGFKLKPIKCDFNISKRKGRDKVRDLYASIQCSMQTVPPLQSIARAELRNTFKSKNFEKKLDSLDIPNHLKLYLLFRETSFRDLNRHIETKCIS